MAEREVQRLAKILGNSIVERRKILGMTQIELANRLDMAPDALSRIENGYVAPRFNRIEEMAPVLECSVAELFREKNDSLRARADSIADIISPLPAEKQEEVISLVSHFVRRNRWNHFVRIRYASWRRHSSKFRNNSNRQPRMPTTRSLKAGTLLSTASWTRAVTPCFPTASGSASIRFPPSRDILAWSRSSPTRSQDNGSRALRWFLCPRLIPKEWASA